jgi:hypothetical protein
MREYQVRICERLRVKFPGPTRQQRHLADRPVTSAVPRQADHFTVRLHFALGPPPDIRPSESLQARQIATIQNKTANLTSPTVIVLILRRPVPSIDS